MEDYRVTQTGDEIQRILNQSPIDTADIAELKEAATSLDGRLESAEVKIPAGASEDNPLTDKQYVDDNIASASATFRGTYNEVTDLELTTEATHAEIGEALASVIDTADSNDYCFVQIPTADATPTEIESIERYKFVTGTGWQYEYTLNNSGFTADQWAAINSGITTGLVAKLTDLPTNAELNTLLNGKANAADVYTKSETYTKTELDTQLGAKANSADVYPKTDTYTKQEVDALITTPEVQYVTVTATSGTTSVTDVLPATGAANTIYRVGSWDGTQYDDGVYSEYSWNGSAYILLDVKNYGLATGSDFNNPTSAQRSLVTTVGSVLDGMPEGVFDVSARNSGSTWASLSALLSDADLDTLIPASWRKGGMSIRFVCSSDNKYVQYRLMSTTWSTVVADWQGVDSELVAGSRNLVENGIVYYAINKLDTELNGQQEYYDEVYSKTNTWTQIPSGNSSVLSSSIETPIPSGTRVKLEITEGFGTIISNFDYYYGSHSYITVNNSSVEFTLDEDCPRMSIRIKSSSFIVAGTVSIKMTKLVDGTNGLTDTVNELCDFVDNIQTNEFDDSAIVSSFVLNKYKRLDLSKLSSGPNDLEGAAYTTIPVVYGEKYKIFSKGTSDSVGLYAITDIGLNVLDKVGALDTRQNGIVVTIPQNAAFLYVNSAVYDSSTDKVEKLDVFSIDSIGQNQSENTLVKKIKENGTNIMCFGDSITAMVYQGSGYVEYLAKMLDADVYRAGIGGTRYVPRAIVTQASDIVSTDTAYAAVDVLNLIKAWCDDDYSVVDAAVTYLNNSGVSSAVASLKAYPIEDVDIVTIMAGTNDFSSSTPIGSPDDTGADTVCGAINYILSKLLTVNSKLKIYVFTPLVRYIDSKSNDNWCDNFVRANGDSCPLLVDAIIKTCLKNHIPVCDLYHSLGWNKVNFENYFGPAQLVHPILGFRDIARMMYNFITDNNTSYTDIQPLEVAVKNNSELLSEVSDTVDELSEDINGNQGKVITLLDDSRKYTAIPSGTSSIKGITNVALYAGDIFVFEVGSEIQNIVNGYNYYVEGVIDNLVAVDSNVNRIEVPITQDVVSSTIYLNIKTAQWKNDAAEQLPVTFSVKFSVVKPPTKGLDERVSDLENAGAHTTLYEKLEDAVAEGVTGIVNVGENVVIGLNSLTSPYTAADIERNYINILPCPKFPFIKKVTLQRLYDDASTPNMLYICSHSDKHIFYSICPTDTKHIDYNSFDEYNSNYFYYANKNTPSTLTKVVLPSTVGGVNIARRIKYVFEMSNGDCLIEIENGTKYTTNDAHNNIYKASNVFSGNTIHESDITLSLSFDVRNERISAFDQIQEYKAGHIVLAPYGSKKTAKVYITKDYGDTWDLIFCADDENETHFIKPKAQRLGDANAYGVWPTEPPKIDGEYVPNEDGLYVSDDGSYVSENPLDWSATGNNNIHIHGITYDPWYDRIWICTGDGGGLDNNVTGIWWTDDEGLTWKRVGGSKIIGTQLMGIIPMEHCVLFSTDGIGDGYWRWSRTGKDKFIRIENCYNYLGTKTGLIIEAGRSIRTGNGFALTSFAPDNESQGDWAHAGGIVATYNGFSFEKIYEDSFTEGTFETAEIGWSCDITDCGDKLILKADKGGFIQLDY